MKVATMENRKRIYGASIAHANRRMYPLLAKMLLMIGVLLVGDYIWWRWDDFEQRQRLEAQIQDQQARNAAPGSEWFQVHTIVVPDTARGEPPQITYIDREFRFNGRMTMDWNAAIFRDNGVTHEILCSGEGSSPNYSKKSEIPVPVDLIKWWLGKEKFEQCQVWPFPPGRTCGYTHWDFTPMREPDAKLNSPILLYPKKRSVAPVFCWETLP